MTDREEWAERKLAEAEAADSTPIPGKKSVALRVGDKVYKGRESQPDNDWRAPDEVSKTVDWELPAITKRDPLQKAEALGSRLWLNAQKDPVQMKLLLQRVQGYLWEQGKPCSYEDVQRVAGELLAQAEAKEKEKYARMTSH